MSGDLGEARTGSADLGSDTAGYRFAGRQSRCAGLATLLGALCAGTFVRSASKNGLAGSAATGAGAESCHDFFLNASREAARGSVENVDGKGDRHALSVLEERCVAARSGRFDGRARVATQPDADGDGSSVPLAGPGYGCVGAGCRSWAIRATASNTNRTANVIAVPRRTARGYRAERRYPAEPASLVSTSSRMRFRMALSFFGSVR